MTNPPSQRFSRKGHQRPLDHQAGSVVGNVLYALAGLMHSKIIILASRTIIGTLGGYDIIRVVDLYPSWFSLRCLQKIPPKIFWMGFDQEKGGICMAIC